MTVIRMSVATVTASLAAEISLCAVIVYNHRLGQRKWRYNRSIKPAPELQCASALLVSWLLLCMHCSVELSIIYEYFVFGQGSIRIIKL